MERDFVKIYKKYAVTELTEHIVYHKLASSEKKLENKEALEKLSQQEKFHYEFWQSLIPDVKIKARKLTIWSVGFVRAVLGVTFTTKLLETHEGAAINTYQKTFAEAIPDSHKERFKQIIEDEKSHEGYLISQLKEKRIAYIGFVALGLADAIVEITGVHAGFLGVTGSTLIAGVSGVIVGFAAAISMASAAYIQAKQDTEKSAVLSAIITGISYLSSVIVLALPYFLIRVMLPAFVISTGAGLILLAGFTFYGAIVFDRKFWREFAESAGLMLGTALATFILGNIINRIFHINARSF